jgi:polysaccharide export outer membrane protein
MQNRIKLNYCKAGLILIILIAVSCVPIKQLSYFSDINDLVEPGVNPRTQKIIMPFDKLYIKVLSIDTQTSQIFNTSDEERYGNNGVIGYLVDEAGNINFPFVGNIKVSSLTTSQASEKIQKALSEYVSPKTSIIVKYIDNRVTVMGEVKQQGVFSFSQDKLNIYEALGLGGGLTQFGDRKKIILIRNEGDKIMHYQLNLSDSKIASKDTYYIHPNDVIIVEPLKAISASYQNITYTTILSSITTLIAVLLFTNVKF